MKKIITIGGVDYAFEYTLEASLCEDFVERLTKYVMEFSNLIARYDIKGKGIKNENEALDVSIDAITEMITKNAMQVPQLTLTGFYAGLLEHQKINKQEAYDLYKKYMQEYKKTPADILGEIINKVNEDNFFAMIGLDLTKWQATNKSATKKPKKSSTKQ